MIRLKKEDGSNYPEWEEKAFGQIFDMFQTNTFSRDLLNYESGDTFNVHYGDILVKFGSVIDCEKEELPFINGDIELLKYKDESYIQDGDIIVADTAEDYTAGKVSEVINTNDKKILSGLHTMLCRPNIKFAPKFLGYYMNSEQYHKQIVRLLVGTKVYSINKRVITDTILKYPCLEEQHKIADFLSNVDDVITASEQEVAALEEQKKGVMQKIFSQEVRFKADDGSEYPEWEEKRIADLFKISAGGDIDKDNSSDEKTEEYIYPIYANSLTNDGLYGYANYYKVNGETLTVTGRGDVGHATARHTSYVPIVRLLVLEPIKQQSVDFFAEVINSTRILIESTGVPQLTAPQIGKIKVSAPCYEEQKKIADFLSDFNTAIDLAKQELEQWKELKKGLLQQLFE